MVENQRVEKILFWVSWETKSGYFAPFFNMSTEQQPIRLTTFTQLLPSIYIGDKDAAADDIVCFSLFFLFIPKF